MISDPLLIEPRLDPKPWGGQRLAGLGLKLPASGAIGEALVTADDASIRSGSLAGAYLGDVVREAPQDRLGEQSLVATSNRPLFPLLVKLIDATENLSVQLHPDDDAARALDRLGKTEAWHVLAADPGATLYLGLQPGASVEGFVRACRVGNGQAPTYLRRVPAIPGTTVLIPAGTVHALGAGVLLYEIQQPSDVTFRLDDWGRRDAAGNQRDLHIEAGLASLVSDFRPEIIPPVELRSPVGRRHVLAACRYFALERIAVAGGETVPLGGADSPQVLTAIQGSGEVRSGASSVDVSAGSSAVILTGASDLAVHAKTPLVMLRAWVPELARDIIAPARKAQTEHADIAALAGPLSDIRSILS